MNKKETEKKQQNRRQNTYSFSTEGEKIPSYVLPISNPLVKIANILLWLGESIIVFINIDWLQLRAADIKYFAGILVMLAAKSEGQEVRAYTGIIPEENPAKVVGTIISQTGAAILISVLENEIAKTKKTSNAPVISPFIGGVGAVQ